MSTDQQNDDAPTIAADGQLPTQKALRECAKAMAYMLKLGWTKAALPQMIESLVGTA